MDEAERRFRARADRFKRDLNKIVFRAIDQMVSKTLKDAEKTEAAKARAEAKAAAQLERALAKQAREEERARLRAAKEAERRAKAEAKRAALASQLELKLGVNGLRGFKSRAGAATRVREDSILGAELKASIDLSADVAKGVDGIFSNGPAEQPPSKTASERPLFVHKRARDGRIHALRRGSGESGEAGPSDVSPSKAASSSSVSSPGAVSPSTAAAVAANPPQGGVETH